MLGTLLKQLARKCTELTALCHFALPLPQLRVRCWVLATVESDEATLSPGGTSIIHRHLALASSWHAELTMHAQVRELVDDGCMGMPCLLRCTPANCSRWHC